MKQPRIGIIGGGSIGSYFAIKLASAGFSPKLITHFNNHIKSAILISHNKIFKGNINQLNKSDYSFDILIIAVKSYSLENVYNDYQKLISECNQIIFVQSNINFIKSDFPFDYAKVFFCPVLFSAIGNYRSIVYELNKGSLILGTLNKSSSEKLFQLKNILDVISPTDISNNINFDLFLKIIINTSLFPLAIILGTNFGTAYNSDKNIMFAANIFMECINLAKRVFATDSCYIFGHPLKYIDFTKCLTILRELVNKYTKVIPSVLFDLLLNKEVNELPYFFDDILKLSLENDIEMSNLNIAHKKLIEILDKKIPLQESNIKFIKL